MGLYLHISIAFLLCFSIFIVVLAYYKFHKISYIIFISFILFGFFSVNITDYYYFTVYNDLQQEKEYTIEAIIVSDVIEKEYKNVYEIELRKVNGDLKYAKKRWLLQVKNSNINVSQKLQFGDHIMFKGKIEIPSSARNYMGFDYQRYLKSEKLYGTIISNYSIEVVQQNKSGKLEKIWHDVKNSIKEKIYRFLPNEASKLCIGILIGEREDISEDMSNYFKKSNLTHMLAVSGAHISYIILGLIKLLKKANYKFRQILIMFFLCFFIGLTGFTPSVQRAGVMAILLLIAKLLHRKVDLYTSLAFSSFAILLYNPYVILNIGFQLSYGGTIGIILFQEKLAKLFPKMINILTVTISANLVIIPIIAFHFNTLSFTFWISNLFAGPLLGVIIILGFILYFTSFLSTTLATLVAIPLKYILSLLIIIAKYSAKIPFSSVLIRTPFFFEIVIYYFIICNFSSFKVKIKLMLDMLKQKNLKKQSNIHENYVENNIEKRNFICLICIILIIIIIVSICIIIFKSRNSLQIYFVDVGQGDCTLIYTPTNKTILIDGGGSEKGGFDVGEKTLLPYLLDRKITKIDYMIISHFDTDHVRTVYYMY